MTSRVAALVSSVGLVVIIVATALLWPLDNAFGIGSATEQWIVRYDGPTDGSDQSFDLAVDDLGNTYVTGVSGGNSTNLDIVTIKYKPDGSEQWVARYDGPASATDIGRAIATDEAGNVYVIGGVDLGTASEITSATIKYDPNGNEQWVALHQGASASFLALDDEGNVYVAGERRGIGQEIGQDIVVIKYGPGGREKWVAHYDNPHEDDLTPAGIALAALAADDAGNVYVTSTSWHTVVREGERQGIGEYTTIKYGPDGSEQWVATYDGSDSGDVGRDANVYALALDASGNIYVTGAVANEYESSVCCGDSSYATVKYSPDGSEQWVATYDGSDGIDAGRMVAVDELGNVYVTGRSIDSTTTAATAVTIKYGPDGGEEWVARYKGAYGFYLKLTANGDVHVAALKSSGLNGYVAIKYGPDGNEMQATLLDSRPRIATGLIIDSDASIYMTGYSAGCSTGLDYVTIKYADPAPKHETLASPSMGCRVSNGDASCDGVVNSIDAALVLQFGAGLRSVLPCGADVNGDGEVTSVDATLILQFDAGLLSSLPP